MSEIVSESVPRQSQVAQLATPPAPGRGKGRIAAAYPTLEKLATCYPQLFGARFLPLKLGIFQDLMAAQPNLFSRDELKLALSVHTRSTRYLQAVASGLARHDLSGQPVEPVAPEHVFMSLVEVFSRRQARTCDDLLPELQTQLARAYEASGLTRTDYLARLGVPDPTISAVLDEAIHLVDGRRARATALAKAFRASGKTADEFAAMFGADVREVRIAAALPL